MLKSAHRSLFSSPSLNRGQEEHRTSPLLPFVCLIRPSISLSSLSRHLCVPNTVAGTDTVTRSRYTCPLLSRTGPEQHDLTPKPDDSTRHSPSNFSVHPSQRHSLVPCEKPRDSSVLSLSSTATHSLPDATHRVEPKPTRQDNYTPGRVLRGLFSSPRPGSPPLRHSRIGSLALPRPFPQSAIRRRLHRFFHPQRFDQAQHHLLVTPSPSIPHSPPLVFRHSPRSHLSPPHTTPCQLLASSLPAVTIVSSPAFLGVGCLTPLPLDPPGKSHPTPHWTSLRPETPTLGTTPPPPPRLRLRHTPTQLALSPFAFLPSPLWPR